MIGFLRPILRPGDDFVVFLIYIICMATEYLYIIYTAIGMDSASLPVGNGRVEDLLC